MKMITYSQLKIIYTLLGQLELKDRKSEIVYSFTEGRTESCREMTLKEAKGLIEWLKDSQERNNIVLRIWHLAYEMEIIVPGDQNEKMMNRAKLDAFCKERGTIKKSISMQSLKEVKRTLKQFEAMYKKWSDKQNRIYKARELNRQMEDLIQKEEYEKAAEVKNILDGLITDLVPKRKKVIPF